MKKFLCLALLFIPTLAFSGFGGSRSSGSFSRSYSSPSRSYTAPRTSTFGGSRGTPSATIIRKSPSLSGALPSGSVSGMAGRSVPTTTIIHEHHDSGLGFWQSMMFWHAVNQPQVIVTSPQVAMTQAGQAAPVQVVQVQTRSYGWLWASLVVLFLITLFAWAALSTEETYG